MNVLEHYILEVINIEENISDEYPNMFKVTYKINCYGDIKVTDHYYSDKEQYEKDLKRGYFLG